MRLNSLCQFLKRKRLNGSQILSIFEMNCFFLSKPKSLLSGLLNPSFYSNAHLVMLVGQCPLFKFHLATLHTGLGAPGLTACRALWPGLQRPVAFISVIISGTRYSCPLERPGCHRATTSVL